MRRLVLCLVAAAAAAAPACTDSGEPGATGRTPTSAGGDQAIAFTVGRLNVEAGTPPSPEAVERTKLDIHSTLNAYLAAGVVTPLRNGGPAGDISPTMTPAARQRLGGPDHPALVDEGLPPVEGLSAERAVLDITVFAGQGGEIVMASAGFDVKLQGRVQGSPLAIDRTGEFFLIPESGAWRIDGYQLQVSRHTAGSTTTSTAQG